jgi:ectoine hydroxylase-related dioxygenase (phytanoyl-CoA dioxygenase family)
VTADDIVAALETEGYVVLDGMLDSDEVATARRELAPLLESTPFGDNSFVGRRTKRLFGLPAKTRSLDRCIADSLVDEVLERVLGPYLLSTAVAVEIHPGEPAQTMHTDGSAWPVPQDDRQIVVNAIWALDDFTEENGATVLVPLGDREARHTATMPAGAVLLYVGTLLHGGGTNRTDTPRLGVVLGYTAAWLRQQETFTLTCPPSVAREAPPRVRELLGYRLYPPFVGHVDGRDPAGLFD